MTFLFLLLFTPVTETFYFYAQCIKIFNLLIPILYSKVCQNVYYKVAGFANCLNDIINIKTNFSGLHGSEYDFCN